jgi:hypothetical protein
MLVRFWTSFFSVIFQPLPPSKTMARQKLYNTLEEKSAARRATSKKYYDKSDIYDCPLCTQSSLPCHLLRNRVQICRRSRRAYKKKLKAVRKNPPCRVEQAIGSDSAETDVNSEAEVG